MSAEVIKREKLIEVKKQCDVLVAGGGIAGIAAALAAARNGADVLLLEREYTLGGLATLGLVTLYLPLCDGKGHQLVYGISEELLKLSIKYGAEKNYPKAWLDGTDLEERKKNRYMTQFNPHFFALEVEKLLIASGVKILYGTVVTDVTVDQEKITRVIVENKSGCSAISVKKVIDTTGDADICKFSQAPVSLYSKNSGLASWYYYLSKGNLNLKMYGLADVVNEDTSQGSSTGNETVDVLSERRYCGTDGDDLSQMVVDGHQSMLKDILKAKEKNPDCVPVTISTIPLMRMSRRLVGEYELDESESHKFFADSIGMTGDWRNRGPAFEIPFGCLYSRKVKNLLVAGRDISVTEPMWDITRVIPPCAVTGEAAGTAASMTDDFSTISIEKLQEKLRDQGVRLHINEVM